MAPLRLVFSNSVPKKLHPFKSAPDKFAPCK